MEAINSMKKTVGAEKANIEFEQLDLSSLQNISQCVDRSTFRSGELSGKMLLVRIVENNKIDDYLGQVRLSKG